MWKTILKKTNLNAWPYQANEVTFEYLSEKHNMAALIGICGQLEQTHPYISPNI
jgi:hypothetical protein